MAFQTTTQLRHDGINKVVMHFTGVCDGGPSGDEKNEVKVDASRLDPVPRSLAITRIDYNVSGGIVRILRDTEDPATITDLSGTGHFDYTGIGGLVHNKDVFESGNILFSTIGFDVGSSYAITLSMRKKQKKS